MTTLLLFLILLSNIAWSFAYLASAKIQGTNWLLSLLTPGAIEPESFIPIALVIAIVFQLVVVFILLWDKSRKIALRSKLQSEREKRKDLKQETKEVKKEFQQQTSQLSEEKTSLEYENEQLTQEKEQLASKVASVPKAQGKLNNLLTRFGRKDDSDS
ncbi:MAG: hypothetical protein K9M03_02690 [Kiritimatiellales bacterium]|nr:hypothetical protein [Kiritimatiellales bacterium]